MRFYTLQDWEKYCIRDTDSILSAAEAINVLGKRTVAVVDEDFRLLGVISDSEIRRGILQHASADSACGSIMNQNPVTVGISAGASEVRRRMEGKELTLLPIIDNQGLMCGAWAHSPDGKKVSNQVVIMAGGKGRRMLNLTAVKPKPLVEVKGKKLLERLLLRVAEEGFVNVTITTHHMSDQIMDFVGDGGDWGLDVSYVLEQEPLGTAGSLAFLSPHPTEPILVTNADLISSVSFSQLLDFHLDSRVDLTVAMVEHEVENPYGVIEFENNAITGIREKPIWREFVSAGIYVLEPQVLDFVKAGEVLDMPELLNRVARGGKMVHGFPLFEQWMDIGTPDDYEKAQSE